MSRRNVVPQPNASVIDGFYDPSTGELRLQLDKPLAREGSTNCAFVMDASGSMAPHYRRPRLGLKPSNVENFIRQAGAFVANYDSDHGVQVYLCCLGDGTGVQDLGNFPQDGLEKLRIDSPNLGGGTYILPALQRVVKEVVMDSRADYGFIVLPTDGEIHDLGELRYGPNKQLLAKSGIKGWAYDMAHAIQAKRHAPFKIVLIGFDNANEQQMEELDNLDTDTPIDIFNALFVADLAGAMDALDSEAVNNEFTISSGGYLEANGQPVVQFETGVPQRIDATVPPGLSMITVVLREGAETERLDVQLPR